jgi:hypothetical protein
MSCFAILMGLTTSISAAIDISSDHIGNVFTDGDPVRLRVETTAAGSVSVTDYEGNEVFEGEIAAGESTVEVGKLARGHYIISIRGGEEHKEARFGVIPSPESRPDLQDSNIASDIAMSWLVKPEKFDDLAKLTKLSGLIWARDRIRWGEIETQRGEYPERTRYDDAAEIQVKHGLKVYQVFHDTPGWARKDGRSRSFPDDLRDAYSFAAEMARRFKGKVHAWELWNEPDIEVFSNELGDAYAALAKAMYLGFKSVDPEIQVLLCSFAMAPGRFAETMFQNRLQNYFDIYNYHIYDKWENHVGRALKHIEVMRHYGLERKPIWLTEAGHPIKRNPDLLEMTQEQEREVADFLPKAIISSLSAGVDKYFWFIMPYYRERDTMLFGLLRDDMTPTAGYCALAACTYALGKAGYLGMLSITNVHAHVFNRGDDRIAVSFWTDDRGKTFRLRVNADKARLVNLMGVDREIEASDGVLELKAKPSVQYLILPAGSLRDAPMKGYVKERIEDDLYDPEKVSHIVLRLQFPRECRDKKAETYMLPGDSPTKVNVEVYNFGESEFHCMLNPQLPEGWKGILDSEEFHVSPMGREVKELELSPGSEASSERAPVRVDLMNSSGKVETFVVAWLAARTG